MYFAIILIALVALFAIAGTLIESFTKSHLYAASLTYESPLFIALLVGFFINILFSALRRWPFKFRHVPFLITHLGLLMILAGVMIKFQYGVQGTLHLIEGSGSHDLYEANTFALRIDGKDDNFHEVYQLTKKHMNTAQSLIAKRPDGTIFRLKEFIPNSTEKLTSWIKGSFGVISGLKPQPLVKYESDKDVLPPPSKIRFSEGEAESFDFYAITTNDLGRAIKALYVKNTDLIVSKRSSNEVLATFPLESLQATQEKLPDGSKIKIELMTGLTEASDIDTLKMIIFVNEKKAVSIPLNKALALENVNLATPYLGKFPLAFDISKKPLFALIQDPFNDVHMAIIDSKGQLIIQKFQDGVFDPFIAYDNGFSGYGTKADIPFDSCHISRCAKEQTVAYYIYSQIQKAEETKSELQFPLNYFQKACKNQNISFADAFTTFLFEWDNSHSWLFTQKTQLKSNLQKVFQDPCFDDIPLHILKGCTLVARFFDDISDVLESGFDPYELLVKNHWPLIDTFTTAEIQNPSLVLAKVTEQIFSAATFSNSLKIEETVYPNSPNIRALYFSALLRAYHIDNSHLISVEDQKRALSSVENIFQSNGEETPKFIESEQLIPLLPKTLETKIIPSYQIAMPTNKIEDNTPCIVLNASQGKTLKLATLRYDKSGKGLKWPIMDGKYLARFQPNIISIPYHVRLRQARQINYPNSRQAFSYECDIIVKDLRTGQEDEKTISMNDVHETWDGYRLYLSSISGDDSSLKHIQVVVNRDVAKYWLTYPGGIILTCGILALFILRPYKPKN